MKLESVTEVKIELEQTPDVPTSSRRRPHSPRPLTPPYVLTYTAVPMNFEQVDIISQRIHTL